jgi:aminoglycoside phosphotransferase (APT) family kinase protein
MSNAVSIADAATEIAQASPERPRIDPVRLQRFLDGQPDLAGPVRISDLNYVEDGGSSNGIALFEVSHGGGDEALVLRYAPGEQLIRQKRYDEEYLTLKALRAGGVAAPVARWCEPTGKVLGFPFLVMERLTGRAPSARTMYSTGLLAEASPSQRKAMLLDAAGFHGRLRKAAITADMAPHLAGRGDGATAIERELNWWLQEALLATEPNDARRAYLVELNRWMIANQPEARPGTLTHGDGQIANLMFHDGRFVAALDWELSYLGHNEADLALVIMLISKHVPAGEEILGLPTEAEIIERYEREAGAPVEHWAYFKLFNLVKVSTIMVMTARHMGAEMADALWQLNAVDRDVAWHDARAKAGAR